MADAVPVPPAPPAPTPTETKALRLGFIAFAAGAVLAVAAAAVFWFFEIRPTPPPVPPLPPISGDGLRALIVYETGDLAKMPAAQRDILYSDALRKYLSTKAAKGPDGKTPEWRVYDQAEDTTNESRLWQDAMKRPRKSL